MSKLKKIIPALLVLAFFASGCNKKTSPAKTSSAPVKEGATKVESDYVKEGYEKAKVVDMTGLDGCKFMIELTNGDKLEPNKLDNKYMKDKMNVWVKYTLNKNGASVCMSGKMIVITDIVVR